MAEALQRYSKSASLMQFCGKAMHMPACAYAISATSARTATNYLELPQANGMRTPDIPVCGISRKVGRQLYRLAVTVWIQYLT